MTFLEAIKEARTGKKVRHSHWFPSKYLHLTEDPFRPVQDQCGETPIFDFWDDQYFSDGWEIYEGREWASSIYKTIKNKLGIK